MSLKRTAILLAVSHANHHHSANNSSSSNVWNSLASGPVNSNSNSNSHSNATDFYTATNFNHTNKSYNNQGLRVMRPGAGGFHGNVNILLGGAMLTVVTTIVCLICYCCHRKIKIRASTSSLYRQQRWMEADPSMEIYSVEQYFDTSGLYTENDNLPTLTVHNEPPPSYECVMALDEVISRKRKNLYTFKGHQHHHSGLERKDCIVVEGDGGSATPTPTPQTSLDEANCDIQSPSSATSLCNCNCVMNQTFTANLCANCNNVIDNDVDDDANNNIAIACIVTTITGTNNCPLSDTRSHSSPPTTTTTSTIVEHDTLLNDQLNNNSNNNDCNGNNHQFDSTVTPSTSTASTTTQYVSCLQPLGGERQNMCLNETEGDEDDDDDDDDDDEIDCNGNCRRSETVNLKTINRNGLIRLDMSQIIDQTGLPTYEAALQLKSSGYV